MFRNILICLVFLFTVTLSGQTADLEGLQEVNYVKGLSPQERVNYLSAGQWQFHFWTYNENSYSWSLTYTDIEESNSLIRIEFKKYFLDNDNDSFLDEYNYVCFYTEYYANASIYASPYNTEPGELLGYNNIYGTNNEVIDDSPFKYYLFNNEMWIRLINDYFDCDDNNFSLGASTFVKYWVDNDGDGFGGFLGQKFFPLGCPPADGYSLTNDDCNDYDPAVTTQPINWHPDYDNDGFGNPNAGITACSMPNDGMKYVTNGDDCDDYNAEYNNEDLIWYADFDNDGFGDENDFVVASCPQQGYVTNCYFDECPTIAGTREGCPVIQYNFDNENRNYNYERLYLEEFNVDDLANVTNEDVLEQITYYDGIKRVVQQQSIRTSPLGNDVVYHSEFDGNGESNKSFLPFVNTNSSGLFDSNALTNTLNYYNTPEFEGAINPYSETILEASPVGRVIEEGAPGEDWLVNTESDNDHTIKYDYGTNSPNSIKKFSVIHANDFIENTEINYDGFYLSNDLTKIVTKNENWQPNPDSNIIEKNNTEETYSNHLGQTVLKRAFVDDDALDTYYIYDDLGNLSYVLPPEASYQILEFGEQAFRVASQTNFSWVDLVNIDKDFADEYNKGLSDYDNVNILNADIENKYGGQGGFTVTTFADSELVTLGLSFSSLDEFELKQGELISLKPFGSYKDTELGRVTGIDYEYIFYIKNNSIYISGGGKLNNIVNVLNSNSTLDYNEDYLWTTYVDVDKEFVQEYDSNVNQIAKETGESILNVGLDNPYGGQGGLNVIVDGDDNITLTFNSSNSTPLELNQGVILNLNSKRRFQNRELGSISGANFNYIFSLEDNAISVSGSGSVTLFNGTIFSPNPPPDPTVVPQTVEGLSYIYHYDYRNRIVEKKTPDKGWEYIVYNKLDQPVLTQDANMRVNNQWLFVKYDVFGRLIYSGLYVYTPTGIEDNSARIELQGIMDNQTVLYENKVNVSESIDNTNLFYTNNTYPYTNNLELHSVTYYDDYSALETNNSDLLKNEGDVVYDETISMRTNKLTTSSKTRVLGTDNWITSVIYYDDKGTAIFVASTNDYLKTVDITENDIDFTGKIIESKSSHSKRVVNCSPVTVENPLPNCTEYLIDVESVDAYTYDRVGRFITHVQTINNGTPELIINNTYNELGQLNSKKVGGSVESGSPEESEGLQTIDCNYTIRGWLKSVNDGLVTGDDLFGYKLSYNSTELTGATPLYNGNISETHWVAKTSNGESENRAYDYSFDALNRLKSANYHRLNASEAEDYSLMSVDYDKNGNILSLKRKGRVLTSSMVNNVPTETVSMDLIDILVYEYSAKSNKLINIVDTATHEGFVDGNDYYQSGNNDYLYDVNGNLIEDTNKNISITYNQLGLPIEIKYEGSDTKKINYTYSADGRKMSKTVTNEENVNTSFYAGKFIYQNNVLKVFSQPEGYVEPNGSGYSYVYQYKDHLGNVRLSYKDVNNDNQIDGENEIVLVKAYYPFGLEHQGGYNMTSADANTVASKFKYNGTELEESFGINLYEMPFRQYDPAIARWTSIDPVTHFSMSPYTGFDNNPVYWSDPSGANGEDYDNDYDERDDWIYNRKTKKYEYDEDVTSEDDQDLDTDLYDYVGVGLSDIDEHFDENNSWLVNLFFDPEVDFDSFKEYLSNEVACLLENYITEGIPQDLNGIRGLYENLDPYAINKGRYTLDIDFNFDNQNYSNKAYVEMKLFGDRDINTIDYVSDESQLFAKDYPFQLEFYSRSLDVEHPQPIIHLLIHTSGEDLYDRIKSYSN